jgi:hypothetical protein
MTKVVVKKEKKPIISQNIKNKQIIKRIRRRRK